MEERSNLSSSFLKENLSGLDGIVGYNVLSYDIRDLTLPSFDYLFAPNYYSVSEIYMFGSRKSAKTKHTALRIIYRLITDQDYNALVIRKIASEITDSVRVELEWAINALGLTGKFDYGVQKKTFTYKQTGQVILMKGISINPSSGKPSLSGLNVVKGWIKDVWIEEAWETTLDDYTMIKGTIRGGQYTLLITGNPYFEFIWCVARAVELLRPDLQTLKDHGQQWKHFDKIKKGRKTLRRETIVHWNNFQINTFLSEQDIEERWEEEERNPKDFNTTGYGMVGSPSGTILGDLTHRINHISLEQFINTLYEPEGGIDVGLTNDATCAVFGGMLNNGTDSYVDEYYHSNGDQVANIHSNPECKWAKKDPDELAIDVMNFFLIYESIWDKFQLPFKVAVDSADRAFLKMLNNKAMILDKAHKIKFIPTVGKEEGKKEIQTRIIEWRTELSHGKTAMVYNNGICQTPRLLYEMNNLPWKLNKSNGLKQMVRDDTKVPDHATNAAEYKKRRNQAKRLKLIGM